MSKKGDAWMPGRWIEVSPFRSYWPADIPAVAGVYVIMFGPEAIYVGQSVNLRARIAQHNIRYGYARNIHTPWGQFPDDIGLRAKIKISKRLGDWAMWEIRLIQRLQPRFNATLRKAVANG